MKITAVLSSILFAHQAEAKLSACGFNDYAQIYAGLALGVQQDNTDTKTDCYGKTEGLSAKTKQFFDSFSNWKSSDWAQPLYVGAELSTSSTDVYTACQTTNLAKQFAVRMNSWSGLLDLGSTIGVAFLTEYATKPGKSKLFNAWNKFIKAETCQETATGMGESL